MATKSYLKRGFKAKAERISTSLREELGLEPFSPLCAFDLASHLGVEIISPGSLGLSPKELSILMGTKRIGSGWSALTLTNKHGQRIIIHNTLSSEARQQSNLMHELAHIICGHEFIELDGHNLPDYMRYYDRFQEAEAEYLGGCLQLPRESLLWAIASERMTKQQIAEKFIASVQMVNFRINSTGIRNQLRYSKIN